MKTYDFTQQKKQGDLGEKAIRDHFKKDWFISPASLPDQKKGIDFYFQHRRDGIHCTVELKTDTRASQTGNAFVETFSSYPDRMGWAYTCQSDFLFYYLPQDRLIYVFRPKVIKERLKTWEKYPSRNIPNKSWTTRGLLVPLHEFEKHANQTISL
jgi:hypothetical protein